MDEVDILIVDDQTENLQYLSAVLEGQGYRVRKAIAGGAAIEAAQARVPDLILLDVGMPEISGFQVCAQLKNDPRLRDVPVIFLSGMADVGDKLQGFQVGGVDYVTKPYQAEEITARVRTHITMSRQHRHIESLARELAHSNEALEARNADLQTLNERLQTAQEQIVAQQKLAYLGTLTAGIAHELRNPLNFVKNFASISVDLSQEARDLAGRPSPGDTSELVELISQLADNAERIQEHTLRADRVVQGMLLHAGSSTYGKEAFDLNALLSQTVNLAWRGASDLASRRVQVTLDLDDHLPPMTGAGPELARAFLNIVDNAVTAAAERWPREPEEFVPSVRVSTRRVDGQAIVRIWDNGFGVPHEIRDRIFAPFFTTRPSGQGIGLGLSIAWDIVVSQHGGHLKLDSEPGSYAEFVVELPLAESTSSGAAM